MSISNDSQKIMNDSLNQQVNKPKLINDILLICVGIIGFWLFFNHKYNFKFPDYFYNQYPDIQIYIGTNVVSMWADYSYFTYISLLSFSLFALLLGLSALCKLKKISEFLHRDTIVSIIFTNYFITMSLYTIFELTSEKINFGLYALVPQAVYNLITNLIIHYVYFFLSLIVFLKIKVTKSNQTKAIKIITILLISYFIVVKLTGEFCYIIRWFPYIIFDATSLGNMLGINNYAVSIVILVIVLCVILVGYFTIFKWLIKFKNKDSNN